MTGGEKKVPSREDYLVHYTVASSIFAVTLSSIVNEEFFAAQSIWVRAGVAALMTTVLVTATVLFLKRFQRS